MAAITHPTHRVTAAVARMRAAADQVADASVWSMDARETASTLVEITRLKAQIAELEARVAAHAETAGVGEDVAASSAGAWLAHETKTTRAAAYGAVQFGKSLGDHPRVRDALATGVLHVDQARVIIRWVDKLPVTLDAAVRAKAEEHLLLQATGYDAKGLNHLGKHLFEVVAPDLADAEEARLLAREEARAAKTTYLTGYDDGQGRAHFKGILPSYHWAALRKMLHAIDAPKHLAATQGAGAARLPGPEAMGRALCELIERYPAEKLPRTGAVSATIVVLIEEDSLMGRLERAGILDTGERISPGMARRLACEAGILPVVLGGDSQPLDVGRRRRSFTEAQRAAILVRDRGCAAEGCDRTVGLHAHHKVRWVDGGPTDLNNAVGLCHWHHQRAHDTRYTTTYCPTGKIAFHRRT